MEARSGWLCPVFPLAKETETSARYLANGQCSWSLCLFLLALIWLDWLGEPAWPPARLSGMMDAQPLDPRAKQKGFGEERWLLPLFWKLAGSELRDGETSSTFRSDRYHTIEWSDYVHSLGTKPEFNVPIPLQTKSNQK